MASKSQASRAVGVELKDTQTLSAVQAYLDHSNVTETPDSGSIKARPMPLRTVSVSFATEPETIESNSTVMVDSKMALI
jgi:hypothetical protein